jgi:hypothetical protein
MSLPTGQQKRTCLADAVSLMALAETVRRGVGRRGLDRRNDDRGVLLAATTGLLGDWNWYLPRRLYGPRDPSQTSHLAPKPSRR